MVIRGMNNNNNNNFARCTRINYPIPLLITFTNIFRLITNFHFLLISFYYFYPIHMYINPTVKNIISSYREHYKIQLIRGNRVVRSFEAQKFGDEKLADTKSSSRRTERTTLSLRFSQFIDQWRNEIADRISNHIFPSPFFYGYICMHILGSINEERKKNFQLEL